MPIFRAVVIIVLSGRNQLRHAGNVGELVVGDFVALQRHGYAVHAVADKFRRVHAKLRGQHAVVGVRLPPRWM